MSVKLTKRMDGFAQSVASGKNQSDAYRENYSTKTMADKSVWVEASLLAKCPKVSIRIEEIKKEVANEQLWTKLKSIKVLAKIAEEGQTESSRIAAVKELNAMHGFNGPSKLELLGPDGGPVQVKATRTLTELYADMKSACAEKK